MSSNLVCGAVQTESWSMAYPALMKMGLFDDNNQASHSLYHWPVLLTCLDSTVSA